MQVWEAKQDRIQRGGTGASEQRKTRVSWDKSCNQPGTVKSQYHPKYSLQSLPWLNNAETRKAVVNPVKSWQNRRSCLVNPNCISGQQG